MNEQKESEESQNEDEQRNYSDNVNIQKIIIPSQPGAYSFNLNTYSPDILSNYLTKKEFDGIIYKASKVIGNSLQTKNQNDKFTIPKRSWIAGAVCIGCMLFYIIFSYIAKDCSNSSATVLLVFCFIFVSTAMITITYQSYESFFQKTREYKPLNDIIKNDLDKYLQEVNFDLALKGKSVVNFYFNCSNRSIECQVINQLSKKDTKGSGSGSGSYSKTEPKETGQLITNSKSE